MLALGGSIGTGLFVASGAAISQAGPGGALAAYLVIGVMVYFLMTALGELAAFFPVRGTFAAYGERFVDPGFGYALAVNYVYNWAVTIAVDLVAAQIVISYWFPDIPGWYWSALFLALLFFINWGSAKSFGESEFWFAFVKVATIIIFIVVGLLMIWGIFAGDAPAGWANWTVGDAPFAGGWHTLFMTAMVVGFSFQGTELMGIAAGESENPGKNIPKAAHQIFWRILLFYILSILVISLIIPYTDPRLLKNELTDISVSPFTLVFERAGLLSAAAVMNAVVLTTVLSAGNSGLYAATRMLYVLATEGKAPRFFARLSASGVPRRALIAVTAIAALCFLTSIYGKDTVYLWLINTSGMGGFLCWLGIAVCHWRFRRGLAYHGFDTSILPYRAKFFPLGTALAFVICLTVTLEQNYEAFLKDPVDWQGILATYIGIFIFAGVWIGYRLVLGGRFVPYAEMRFPEAEKFEKEAGKR